MTPSPTETKPVLATTPPDEPASDLADGMASSPDLLKSVWARRDTLAKNATATQQRFFFLRRVLAYLSVLVIVLAVVQPMVMNQAVLQIMAGSDQTLAAVQEELNSLSLWSLWQRHRGLAITNFLLILFPITTTGLAAFAVKFDRGHSWVLLRGSSEALKMETFYYRTRTPPYHRHRNQMLATRLQMISERVKGSSVHQTAFDPYEGEPSKRLELGLMLVLVRWPWMQINRLFHQLWEFLFKVKEVPLAPSAPPPTSFGDPAYQRKYADLTATDYLHYRLEEQFDWYRRKAKEYSRQYQIFQTGVYAFSGLGTLLAATGLQNWVAVTAAIATTLVTYLEYRRIEATLVGYNQAADTLYDVRAWWHSLSEAEKAKPENFEKLVITTEETIRSEHNSWLQDMQDRLANLYKTEEVSRSEDQPEDQSLPPKAEGEAELS